MSRVDTLPARPRLRPATSVEIDANEIRIRRGETECWFEYPAEDSRQVGDLIACLRDGGRTVTDLTTLLPALSANIRPLLEALDRLRLLTDSPEDQEPVGVMTGRELYRQVVRITHQLTRRWASSRFYGALIDHSASRSQMIGYVCEYHWFVRSAPGLIAPALCGPHSEEEAKVIQSFFRSELGHDHMTASALAAVGIAGSDLWKRQPLPQTFALGASLGVYARQDPLSFKACLFLFERPQQRFVDAFDAHCRYLGLPEGFHRPLRLHSEINTNDDHEDVSRDLLDLVPLVSPEEATVVKRHVSIMVETLCAQEEAILDRYARGLNDECDSILEGT